MLLEEQVKLILADIAFHRDFIKKERDSGALSSRSSFDIATGKIRALSFVLESFETVYLTPTKKDVGP